MVSLDSLLGDFLGNREYLGKSLTTYWKDFFSLKVATYIDKAGATFPENGTSLGNTTLWENRCYLITIFIE